jgi:hypothetical protein
MKFDSIVCGFAITSNRTDGGVIPEIEDPCPYEGEDCAAAIS